MTVHSEKVAPHAWVIDHPSEGVYSVDCLRWQEVAAPTVGDGEVLVRTLILSIDPTLRNWLRLDPAMQVMPMSVGDLMASPGCAVVEESRHPDFAPGDLVHGIIGWSEQSIVNVDFIEKAQRGSSVPADAYLSVFSHVGRAAVIGLLEIAKMAPGDVVVVSGAAGATGSLAVQLAKARGNRVIGVAGGPDKCDFVRELGADAVIDYKSEDVVERLADLCPDGVDVYFDNVGGPILDAVLGNMAPGCRIAVCGAISQYNHAEASSAYGLRNFHLVFWARARIEGFIVRDYVDRFDEIDAVLFDLWDSGALRVRTHMLEGIEVAPEAINLNLYGQNQGKLMVRVAAE